jgi:DNA-binding transcriptional ArsR family regulator
MGRERRLHRKREGNSLTIGADQEFIKKEMFHKALACRTRLKILAMLEQKSMFGYELVRHLGIGQSTVSYHLGILREAGMITAQQRAEGRLYSLVRADRVA